MTLISVLEEEIKRVKPSVAEKKRIEQISKLVVNELESRIKSKRIKASVFIGGSVAKGTLVKKDKQDIDMFVRFDSSYDEDELKKLFGKLFSFFKIRGHKIQVEKHKGSRDYMRILFREEKIMVEVVPTIKVLNDKEARNITDLSFFHVSYIKQKIKKQPGLADEIILAKAFCHGQNVYGAESYINGFSGYALELLVCHYGSFVNFLKELAYSRGVGNGGVIIDIEKLYSGKEEVLAKINPSKKQSPIILIDPTFKERNVAMALSHETFQRFKIAARDFLAKPSLEFFEVKNVDPVEIEELAGKSLALYLALEVSTNKQDGDIAGTKLKKFYRVFLNHVRKSFDVVESHFVYDDAKNAKLYFILKRKKELEFIGPPTELKDAVVRFKKEHPIWYVKNGKVCAAKDPNIKLSKFISDFKSKDRKLLKQMSITNLTLLSSRG
ncbi:MAG: nucleotidyltransferase domain-containing protein [Candidatus Pacearchaeota archaeon]|jgi:tRNA nucleotidyltransferase (CCA-adding enzyme)